MILKGIYTQKGAANKLNMSYGTMRVKVCKNQTNDNYDIHETEDGLKLVEVFSKKTDINFEKALHQKLDSLIDLHKKLQHQINEFLKNNPEYIEYYEGVCKNN